MQTGPAVFRRAISNQEKGNSYEKAEMRALYPINNDADAVPDGLRAES